MAKTVFGMPGVGSKKEGGDPVAPGGVPGASVGQGLPQKSGKETPEPAEPHQATVREAAAPTKEVPSKPPMAKPAGPRPQAKVGAASPAGGKTVFGMPAVKLPIARDPNAGKDKSAPVTEKADRAVLKVPSAAPVKAERADDAYKATVLGMAAVIPSQVPKEVDIPKTEAQPALKTSPREVERAEGDLRNESSADVDLADQITEKSFGLPLPRNVLILIIACGLIIIIALAFLIFRNTLPEGERALPAPVPVPTGQPVQPTTNPAQ